MDVTTDMFIPIVLYTNRFFFSHALFSLFLYFFLSLLFIFSLFALPLSLSPSLSPSLSTSLSISLSFLFISSLFHSLTLSVIIGQNNQSGKSILKTDYSEENGVQKNLKLAVKILLKVRLTSLCSFSLLYFLHSYHIFHSMNSIAFFTSISIIFHLLHSFLIFRSYLPSFLPSLFDSYHLQRFILANFESFPTHAFIFCFPLTLFQLFTRLNEDYGLCYSIS